MTWDTGRHFLQIPGPTNIPDRVLRAMDMPTMDHRGAEFAQLGFDVLAASQRVFRTKQPGIIYPSSGTGAWEAAIVNTLSPGDKVLMAETGQNVLQCFSGTMKNKLAVEFLPGDCGAACGRSPAQDQGRDGRDQLAAQQLFYSISPRKH